MNELMKMGVLLDVLSSYDDELLVLFQQLVVLMIPKIRKFQK
jgi:hypothetical protein